MSNDFQLLQELSKNPNVTISSAPPAPYTIFRKIGGFYVVERDPNYRKEDYNFPEVDVEALYEED
jgi:hypothetical protein